MRKAKMKYVLPCPKKRRSLRTVFIVFAFAVFITVVLKLSSVHSLLFMEMKHSIPGRINTWENMKHIVENLPLEIGTIIPNSSFSKWEHQLASVERLQDILLSGNSSNSKVHFLSVNTSDVLKVEETQSVALMIDVYNGYNNLQMKGGDEVRVWTVELETRITAVCSVTDLKNGSYTAYCKALFPGILKVQASVVYPKEYLRMVLAMVHQGIGRFMAGLFEQSTFKEVTLCAPFPNLPNYTRVCDLSHENNNMSWYCGRPYNEQLSCSDWKSIQPLTFSKRLPITKAESELIKYISRPPYVKLIPTSLKINVTSKAVPSLNLPLCSLRTRPLLQSWKEQSPRGWFGFSKWQPRTCDLYDVIGDRLRLCLMDTTILLMGDPNQQQIYNVLRELTDCQEKKHGDWPVALVCSRKEWKLKIMSIPHEYPLFTEDKVWRNKTMYSMSEALDKIPPTGKHLVFLHSFLHLTPFHHSVFRERVQRTKDAVDRLLNRNPKAFVAIRGPHTGTVGWGSPVIGGDHFVHHFLNILKEEYEELQSRTLFIDGFDMSVAVGNQDVYNPSSVIQHETARLLLAYACDFFLMSR